jgi:TetR/AcrR family transcriptional regulator, regulator of mycofactocin system
VSASATLPAAVSGRPFSTSREALEQAAFALFEERGFDQTSIDDIADAVGIGRRTFFRYYPSKNDLVWGNFEQELRKMRSSLEASNPETPLMDAIRESVVSFNLIAPGNEQAHRKRMQMILGVPTLFANSTLRFAAWRAEIARFAASRLGVADDELGPVVIGYSALGASIAAYEQWLKSRDADLSALLNEAFDQLATGFRQGAVT